MTNFQLCYRSALPHGILCGVTISRDPIVWSHPNLKALHDQELDYAKQLKGLRQYSWLAGRIAAHHALSYYSKSTGPILTDPYGCPIAPKGYVLSITHKEKIAIAMAAPSNNQHIGVDYEIFEPQRHGIGQKVLRPEEKTKIDALSNERKWISTLLHFSAKEAIYKAIAPRLQRYVTFQEVALRPHRNGLIDIHWYLEKGPTPQYSEARYIWLEEGLLTTAQVSW